MCHDYQNGRCFRATCKFSHEGAPRVNPGGFPGGAGEPCHDFQNGRCFRGDSCRFSHEGAPAMMGMGGGMPMGGMPMGGAAPAAPGDWACASCGENNFARRNECFKCSAVRTDGGAAPGGYGGESYHASAGAAAAVADSLPSRERRYSRSRSRSRERRRSASKSRSRSPRGRSKSKSKSKSRSASPAGEEKE